MFQYTITVDGGTSNTRVYLWEGREFLGTKRAKIGVKSTAINGDNADLKRTIHELLSYLLVDHHVSWDQVNSVYVSGMLTSNLGLYELPHITAPAGIDELAKGVVDVSMPEICPRMISVIPGIRNMDPERVSLDNMMDMDIMRGEETESIALLRSLPDDKPALLVLPGSHTKIIAANTEKKITGCLTCMSGELLELLTKESIVADAVKRQFLSGKYSKEYLLAGARAAESSSSLGHAGFLTRICSQFVTDDPQNCASFLLGAVIGGDVCAARASRLVKEFSDAGDSDLHVLIAGKEPMASAFADVFQASGSFVAELYQNSGEMPLSGAGALMVKERRDNWG